LVPVIVLGMLTAPLLVHADTSASKPQPASATNAAPTTPTKVAPQPAHPASDSDSDDDDTDTATSKAPHNSAHIVITDDDKTIGGVLVALVVPLAGIICTFGMPVVIVVAFLYFRHRRRRETLDMVRECLNKGVPVPPELLAGVDADAPGIRVDAQTGCKSDFRRGFKLAFIGLGVSLALYFNDPHSTDWCWGLIPLVMGIGYLFSAWVQGGRGPNDQDRLSPPKP
jgi:hypothetical protein